MTPPEPAESRQQQAPSVDQGSGAGWVPASERSPELFSLVQFAVTGVPGPTIGKFNGVRWMALFDLSTPGLRDYGKGQVTHWMPLPAPPAADNSLPAPPDSEGA